jgi:hypothetical protein
MKKFITIIVALLIGAAAFANEVGVALPGTDAFEWYNNVDVSIEYEGGINTHIRVIKISQNGKTIATYYGDMWQIVVKE